jgi:exodeoxyribonuclease VII small subunit
VASPRTKPSFEDLYRDLEETVRRLEQGGLSLDDSLAAYEKAVSLAQQCQTLLEQAELRITRLREAYAVAESGPAYDAEPELQDEA